MGIKVLIVEDEFIVANDLRLTLEQAGYVVNGIVASAEEAGAYLEKHKPDMVILDIRLNGKLSGIDFAKKLKEENIGFIYLSANSSQQVLEEARTTEPYGFLIKPFREKELLVSLDIAWYRHKHSLESKLRQAELLQSKLMEICNENAGAEHSLLKMAKSVQSCIPFDLIAGGQKAYLRIGFEEYQLIGEKELLTITGIKKEALAATTENTFADYPSIIHEHAAHSLQKIFFVSFKLESCLVYPVKLSNGLSYLYFFYSHQHDMYSDDHIALLNGLKIPLTVLAEKMLYQHDNLQQKSTGETEQKIFKPIIGNHPLLLASLDLAAQVAFYNTSVLLLGESGTGKEKVAQSIHELSSRNKGPFIKINCAAIPSALIESELFGHEKGAFTGAIEKRKGKFEQAEGGTIFLDEIGELTLEMQVKLLRVLQEKEIETVGGTSSLKVNVRIIAATNRNLEKEVANGNFRLDLYYRLNVFPITLPPLRERKTDIEAIAIFFAKRFCKEFNKPFTGLSASLMEEMLAYNWPGNIRELENVLEQSVILNDGKSTLELKRSLIPTDESAGKISIENLGDIKQIQSDTEKKYIISILKKTNGRIRGANGAAALLNIKPTTLASKIAKLNINRADFMNPVK